MPVTPAGWNILIIGAWNTAILTPDGIRKRLFQLPEGTPVDIDVAIDRPAPHRVRHDGLFVVPSSGALEISADEPNIASLKRASEIACRALDSLPETPLSAAGVNLRYQLSEIPDSLLTLTELDLDDVLSDEKYQILERSIKRTLSLQPGVLNVEISMKQDTAKVLFNFHMDSKDPKVLSDWVHDIEKFSGNANKLLKALSIEVTEGENT